MTKPLGRVFKIAAAQVGGVQLNESKSNVVSRLVSLLEEAARGGASFVTFPELTLSPFFPRFWVDDLKELDRYFEESMPNESVMPLFKRAAELGVGFYLGYAELTAEGRRFNTSILVDSKGELVGKYRKIHLPGKDHKYEGFEVQDLEKRYFEVGDLGFGVFDVDGVLFGMCLCNDRRWPETYRVLALQGADVVVLGYNTTVIDPTFEEEPHQKMETHLLSIRAGAYQNAVWVVAAANSGLEDGCLLIGGSAIVAPSGDIVAKASTDKDEVVIATVDLALSEKYQNAMFNFAAHRRPEHYSLITERVGRGKPLATPKE
jgi:predicted amidohydrolase